MDEFLCWSIFHTVNHVHTSARCLRGAVRCPWFRCSWKFSPIDQHWRFILLWNGPSSCMQLGLTWPYPKPFHKSFQVHRHSFHSWNFLKIPFLSSCTLSWSYSLYVRWQLEKVFFMSHAHCVFPGSNWGWQLIEVLLYFDLERILVTVI